jgi:hypothetical protein
MDESQGGKPSEGLNNLIGFVWLAFLLMLKF